MDKQKVILVVDDVAMIRSLLCEYLSGAGYEIKEAANGKEGWEFFKKYECDLILSDVRMENGDGIELLKKVREVDRDIPVIMVSGHLAPAGVKELMEAGANLFFAKPFTLEKIREGIESCFKRL